jgi:hypothetical protein
MGSETQEARGEVISHIVLFRPRATLTPDETRTLVSALRLAVEGIQTIRRATIGRRTFLHRPGYETQMREHYEYSAVLEFDSESDLRSYLDHPAHTELGTLLFTSAEAVLAYDFNCVGSDRVDELLG